MRIPNNQRATYDCIGLPKYPGYTILRDMETAKQGKNKLIHYKVLIEKGKDKRVLAVDETGKTLRERK